MPEIQQPVSVPSGHRRLIGNIFCGSPHESALRPAVLFVHGDGSSQEGYISRALRISARLDVTCLTFDLSGHGQDEANHREFVAVDHLEDVIAGYDRLVSHAGVDKSRVGACGASYGAYLAALLTAHRPLRRLVLRAPSLVTDLESGRLRIPRLSQYSREDLESLAILKRYEGDVLIVQGEKDEVIPPSHIAAYQQACIHSSVEVIRGARHALTEIAWDSSFVEKMTRWFHEL